MEKQNTLKVNDIVRVRRAMVNKKLSNRPSMVELDTAPKIGRIVYRHPAGTFYVVEFRDKYADEYKVMYRESFWPENVAKINCPEFMEKRTAKKRSWVKQEV